MPAIDLGRSFPKLNLIDKSVDDVACHALRFDVLEGRTLFRAEELPNGPIFLARALGEKLIGFSGWSVKPAKR